jgi:hypothetical protein
MTKIKQARFSDANNHNVPDNPIDELLRYCIVTTCSKDEVHSPSTQKLMPLLIVTSARYVQITDL